MWESRIVGHDSVDPTTLVPNPLNFRQHPENQRAALADAIKEVGYIRSVTVNRTTGNIIDGHARVEEAVRSGQPTIDVEYVELSPEQEKLALATMDPIAALATADAETLDQLLREVETGSAAVQEMLSGLAEDAGLYIPDDETVEAPDAEIDRAGELQRKWKVEPGQLWQVGRHRLLCGDSTDAACVEKLMGREKCDICITSPPYNLGNDHHTGSKKTQAYADDVDERKYQQSQKTLLSLALKATTGDCFYQHKNRIKRGVWITPVDWIRENGWTLAQEVVWINGGPNMDKCRFFPQTERVYWLTRDSSSTRFNNCDNLTDWWQISPVGTGGVHARAFPIEIPQRLLRASDAMSVYEPYCGSGTTMAAAETLGRTCFGLELEPKYCAVILERMSNMGLEPKTS